MTPNKAIILFLVLFGLALAISNLRLETEVFASLACCCDKCPAMHRISSPLSDEGLNPGMLT
jgi:hypothetical protein